MTGITSYLKLDTYFMGRAIDLAREAQRNKEVPVGAVLVRADQIIGEGFNRCVSLCDPSAHAEMLAIRHGGESIQNYRIERSTLYVTLEPCIMCAGAILLARINRVVFSTSNPRFGSAGTQLNILNSKKLNHHCQILSGVLESESRNLLRHFFIDKR